MLALAVAGVGTACGDEPMTPATPDPPVPTTVAVAPPSLALHSIGDSVRMIATVSDQYGQAMTNVAVAWNSSDTSVTTVTEGLVTAVGNGSATVTATVGSQTASAEARVEQEVAEVSVSPPPTVLAAFGDTVRLTAEALDANGHMVAGTAFLWKSGDTLVAMVDSAGLVTAVGNGTTSVAANAGEAMGETKVAVMQSAASVILTPAADSMVLGDTLRLSAEAWDVNGHSLVGTNFSWSSSDGSVATVDSSGLVRGVAEGTATISAAVGSAHGTAAITVSNPDRAALVALYEATDGPNWVNSQNWLTDAPLGDWYGVSAGNRVGQLVLRGNGLTGRIPPDLGNLTQLSALYLDNNALSGPIPAELGSLTHLELLVMDENALSGPIPPELGGLDDLIWLMLDENDLSGPIPSGLGDTSLKILRLNNNNLSGPIPVELGKLKDLEELNVAVNPGLRGEIPPEVLALNMHHFWSWATSLCVPRGGDFESYISRENWMGNACGETEPGFQIQLLFSPETPDDIRDAMESQAEYWMEILRDTEAPDLFGFEKPLCYGVRPWTLPSPIIDDVLVTIEYGEGEITSGGVCGLTDMFPHRIPYQGYADFDPAVTRDPHWLDIIARRLLGHALGFGEALWGPRGQLMDPSTSEQAPDTHVVSPRAEEAFDAAGGTSYTGPKIPLQQDGSNGQWRSSVFGSEIMSAAWSRSGHVPTSAVTLQALADLGYTVDLSYANPFALLSAAASAALGADESGWEAPPVVVSCRSRVQPDAGQEGLSTGLYPSPVRACAREF